MKIIYPNQANGSATSLLEETGRLDTPVARFARKHEEKALTVRTTPRYADLIPLTAPKIGEQYAFEVDLDRCTGCKACVSACHSLNGLMDEETWRDIGLLKGGKKGAAYQQTITTACHHCVDPACLDGCPVDAYEKDPATGIVLHLDDQCIGCQYCVLKCPYDVPKFSEKLGIVRKCDMCHSRLAVGEAPACVQACPNEAIKITTVSQSALTVSYRGERAATGRLLPGTVSSGYTVPTTVYTTRKSIPENTLPADHTALRPQHAHWPLILLLVLTQASVGTLFGALLTGTEPHPILIGMSLIWCFGGLVASIFHLGKPLKAWRAFIGFRHSWLSREIVIFGLYFPVLKAVLLLPVATTLFPALAPRLPSTTLTGWLAFTLGITGAFCSIMIYHDTRRVFWHWRETGIRFIGSAWILGSGTLLLYQTFTESVALSAIAALAFGALLKLTSEARLLLHTITNVGHPLWGTARLLQNRFAHTNCLRIISCIVGAVCCPILAYAFPFHAFPVVALGLALLLFSELAERYLYFKCVIPFKMPGGMMP